MLFKVQQCLIINRLAVCNFFVWGLTLNLLKEIFSHAILESVPQFEGIWYAAYKNHDGEELPQLGGCSECSCFLQRVVPDGIVCQKAILGAGFPVCGTYLVVIGTQVLERQWAFDCVEEQP